MGALLDRFLAVGVKFEATDSGKLLAVGPLTDSLRASIREQKPAILAELLAANDEPGNATRATENDRDDRRACLACCNLSPEGRCLAAWRGERIGTAGRNYRPVRAVPRRCERYAPPPHDPDQRIGRERWPWLLSATDAR